MSLGPDRGLTRNAAGRLTSGAQAPPMRLLLIEDHDALRASLAAGLTQVGYRVDAVGDGLAGWDAAAAGEHDLIVLDRMLPGMDGIAMLRRLRQAGSGVPVLLLSARDTVEDRVEGLEAGADDYLVKPFAVAELLARLKALLRRGRPADPVLRIADLEVDLAARTARRAGRPLSLAPREWDALARLLAAGGAVVPAEALAQALYGGEEGVTANAVEAVLSRLRRKLQPPGMSPLLHTARGAGWRLGVE